MLQHGWKIALLYLIFLFFVHNGRKIAPVLYIYPSTGTENNTRAFRMGHSVDYPQCVAISRVVKCGKGVVFRVSQSHAFCTSIPHFTFRIPHFTGPLIELEVSSRTTALLLSMSYCTKLRYTNTARRDISRHECVTSKVLLSLLI